MRAIPRPAPREAPATTPTFPSSGFISAPLPISIGQAERLPFILNSDLVTDSKRIFRILSSDERAAAKGERRGSVRGGDARHAPRRPGAGDAHGDRGRGRRDPERARPALRFEARASARGDRPGGRGDGGVLRAPAPRERVPARGPPGVRGVLRRDGGIPRDPGTPPGIPPAGPHRPRFPEACPGSGPRGRP